MTSKESQSHSAAHITRQLEDGSQEEVLGAIERDEYENWRIVLNGDFGRSQGIEDFLEGRKEVETYPVLHVRSEHGWFTAVSSRVISRRRNFGGTKLSRVVLRPRYLLEGNTRLGPHELSLTQARLRFDVQNLWTEWASWGVGESADVMRRASHASPSVEFDGARLALVDKAGWSLRAFEHQLFSASDFEYTFEKPIGLDDFFDSWFKPLVFLLTTGTRRRVRVHRFALTNRTWVSDHDGSPLDDVWLTVHVQNPHEKSQPSERALHHLRDFDFEVQVPRVFAAYRDHHDSMEQYLELVHSNIQSPRIRLIAVAQMVESFDRSLTPDPEVSAAKQEAAERVATLLGADSELRGFAPNAKRSILESVRPTFASRLKRLDAEAGGIISDLVEQKSWKNDVQLVRNTVVHGLAQVSFFARNVIPLQVATEILEILFETRLLVAFGFSAERALEIVRMDPQWWQATQQIVPYIDSFREFEQFSE